MQLQVSIRGAENLMHIYCAGPVTIDEVTSAWDEVSATSGFDELAGLVIDVREAVFHDITLPVMIRINRHMVDGNAPMKRTALIVRKSVPTRVLGRLWTEAKRLIRHPGAVVCYSEEEALDWFAEKTASVVQEFPEHRMRQAD